MAIADPKKLLRKVFREYGATRERLSGRDARDVARWVFPDGRSVGEPADPSPQWVAAQIQTCQERYGFLPGGANAGLVKRSGRPRIDLDRLVASEHAKERLRLMQDQADVSFQEVLHCIRLAERVLWSDVHGTWLWVRGRIAVAVAEEGDRLVITTVMWSSDELFQEFPRPEVRSA